jgi:hypothetical protein
LNAEAKLRRLLDREEISNLRIAFSTVDPVVARRRLAVGLGRRLHPRGVGLGRRPARDRPMRADVLTTSST